VNLDFADVKTIMQNTGLPIWVLDGHPATTELKKLQDRLFRVPFGDIH